VKSAGRLQNKKASGVSKADRYRRQGKKNLTISRTTGLNTPK